MSQENEEALGLYRALQYLRRELLRIGWLKVARHIEDAIKVAEEEIVVKKVDPKRETSD